MTTPAIIQQIIPMPMSTKALLTLTQWMSSGFPVSAYAYSHGLERVIDRGDLKDAEGLLLWLADLLNHGSGYSDGLLLAASYRARAEDIADIDATARAFAASSERLSETVDQGTAFTRTVDDIWALDIGPLTYPVAVGRAACLKNLPLDVTLGIFLQAFVANLTSAAVRLIPLGQTEGQTVLANLAPVIEGCAEKALCGELDDLSSSCFALDIAAMHHETQYSKVFRT